MASLSIVILNYNGKHFLEQFLPSIITYSKGYEIVVADNNSSDDSLGFLKNTYPNIRLIEFSKNFGFCTGYNKAIQQLDSEFIVLLNSDIEVTENWVDPVISYLRTMNKLLQSSQNCWITILKINLSMRVVQVV